MKCYCITNFREPLSSEIRSIPSPKGTEVLLQVRAAGVCHSDIHLWEGGYDLGNGKTLSLKDRGVNLPLTLGHETVGTPQAWGPDVSGIEQGHNYLIYPWIGCGQCAQCEVGMENLCSVPQFLGVHRHGGYAEHILVPHPKYLIDIGNLEPSQIAPYACSGLTTYSALKKVGPAIYQHHPIVIMGAGGLGLMCLRLLTNLAGVGAIVVDIDPAKREAAIDAGALAAIDGSAPDVARQILDAMGGEPAQAVIDLVGAASTTSIALDCLGKGGKLILIGLFGGASSWPLAMIPMKAISIIGSYVGNLSELRELIELARTSMIAPIPIMHFPLDQANTTLMALRDGKITGRAVLTA